ncbi:Heparin-sulfate lyase [Bacteroides finegoldii]|uniref:Uncharacterized protein n=1 Tax=Bacteroides finegoldii CL09T03C10 TaxID=997888 RepID=K5CSY0_9BACE|nr:heparin-sulfate lyase HepC [Bacteroides finegoldii]EKJ92946.1 hypothetical protein HMPREF1057_00244 [Bacteroides finegoldii CL09T03C10]
MKNIFFICMFAVAAFAGCTDDDELYKNSGGSTEETSPLPNEDIDLNLFEAINLNYPGLEQVKAWYETGNYHSAAKALLQYYKGRIGISNPNVSLINSTVKEDEEKWANDALKANKYRFYINNNYYENANKKQPYSLLGADKNIDWNFKPEGADNEYQKQLHRHYWLPFQAKAYQKTGNEQYVIEWKEVYADWIANNPKPETPDEFKWWQLQVSTRIMGQTELFDYYKFSPNFTPEWLSFFLVHFAEHADYLAKFKYRDENNILLSQGTALAFAGTLFPEFKNAADWQKMGFEILNEQAKKQFLADGMLGDLSLHYHMGSLVEFYNLQKLVAQNELPASILSPEINDILQNAAELVMHFTYQNYFIPKSNFNCTSALNDSWMKTKSVLSQNFIKYSEMFPDNQELRYMATEGTEGTEPGTEVKAFETSGHYIFRDGWKFADNKTEGTVLIHSNNYSEESMSGADWSHNQPDNGTFELYHANRNFFPDSGVCTYMDNTDSAVKALRRWFRRTDSHNTLTLNNADIAYAKGKLVKMAEEPQQMVVTENRGYKDNDFTHRRSIFFVDKKFFVLVDEGFGTATGTANLNFHLCEKEADATVDVSENGAHTLFNDGNDLLVRSFGTGITCKEKEGRFSVKNDRTYTTRKAYQLDMNKTADSPVRYITVLYPTDDISAHTIQAEFTDSGNAKNVSVKVVVDGKEYNLGYQL